MNIWPFNQKLETRADSSYTDALVAAITANAGGQSTAFASATGALEACAGMVSRAFMTAEVKSDPIVVDALTPDVLGMIGRALIRKGQIVQYIDTSSSSLKLLPCESHDVAGHPDPSTWRYTCTIGGPDRTYTYNRIPSTGVVHLRYAQDPETAWRGIGPLQSAQLAGRLSAETVASLADESSMPRGGFIGLPVDGNDTTIAAMRGDIRKAKGQILTVESGDWDDSGATNATYELKRFGAMPPDSMVELLSVASREVYAACGLNPSLFIETQGSGAREAYRQALFGTIAPLGKLVAAELSIKLETDVVLDWAELRAADIASRARAFQGFVTGGMDITKAAELSGVMVAD